MANINSTLDKNNTTIVLTPTEMHISIPRPYPAPGSGDDRPLEGRLTYAESGMNLPTFRAELVKAVNALITKFGGTP